MLSDKLKKGDTIGIIAPSDYISEEKIEDINQSILLMESSGFQIEFGKHVFSHSWGYTNTPKEKAEDINAMFENKNIKAIFCAIGGENANLALDKIDYETIQNNPKILCGFSDSTSLLNMIYQKTGLVTYHGPTFKSLTSWETEYGYRQVMKVFAEGQAKIGEEEDKYITIQAGMAEGILVGGNLSCMVKLVAGTYHIDFTDKILFLEELGYETDPILVSSHIGYMKQNGVFDQIKGLWIGNYEHASNISLEKIIQDVLQNQYSFPIIKSNNFGHVDKKAIIPIGIKARIDTNNAIKISLLEPQVK